MPKKVWIIGIIIALVVIGSISSSKNKTDSASASSPAAADTVDYKVTGTFHRDCFACGDLKQYIATSAVWCGWKGDKVIVHVAMTNNSAEHVTVDWHPTYRIVGGTSHGTGFSSVESSGFDSGESRDLESEQSPDGVAAGTEIASCYPSFSLVSSG